MQSRMCFVILEISATIENLKRVRQDLEQAGEDPQSIDAILTLLTLAYESYESEYGIDEGYSQLS